MSDASEEKAMLLAAGCFILVGQSFLTLLRNKDGTWGIPGGKVEMCETPLFAVIREVFEEIGLMCLGGDLTFVGMYHHAGCQFHVFELNLSEYPDISVDAREHSEHRWVDLHQFVCEDDPASSSLASLLHDMGYIIKST